MADSSAVSVWIGNRDLTHFARVGRVRIDDVLNDAPNTAALTVKLVPGLMPSSTGPFAAHAYDPGGFNTADGALVLTTPAVDVGAPIAIYLNGGVDQIFGGEVLTREQYAEFEQPKNVRLDLTCTDFTRRLNYRKVSKDYATASATAIVTDVITTFAPNIGTAGVQAGLASISGGITFTFEDVSRALSRIAEKIGAYWYVDYAAQLHFFVGTESGATPAPLVPGGRFADLKISADLSQVRTRILVEGDGATSALTLPAGDSILPVSQTTPFASGGGLATMGAWRIAYTGIIPKGAQTNTSGTASGGSAAGPPPTPPGAPTAAVAAVTTAGALAGGPYYYRVTFEGSDGSRSDVGAPAGPVTITAAGAPPPTSSAYAGGKGPIAVGVTSSYATAFVSADGKTTNATLGGNGLTGRAVAGPASASAAGSAGPVGGLGPGYYRYAVTFLTAAGETLPGFTIDIATGASSSISVGPPLSSDARVVGRRIYRSSLAATFGAPVLPWHHVVDIPDNTTNTYMDGTADANLPTKIYPQFSTATDVGEAATVTVPTSSDSRVVRRRVYRKDGPGEYRLVAEIPDNTTVTFNDVVVGPGGDIAPTVNTIGSGAVNLSAIAIGAAGIVRRRIFRTAAGGSQYRELVNLEDNTTTAVTDTTADANLGGAPQPPQGTPAVAGSIPPTPIGSTSLQVTTLTGFPSSGGWVLLESGTMIRYGATSTAGGNFLTGIPASGPGSIAAAILAGSIVALAPALTGVSPVLAVTLGDAVQLLAQVDDVPAQTALAAIEGGDGIIEHYIQDRRLSVAGATARGQAELALFKTVETRLAYSTHDVETKSGRTVHVALPAPTNLTGDFLIQRVTIDDVSIAANWNPKRKVQASTTRFSFKDVLARLLLEQS